MALVSEPVRLRTLCEVKDYDLLKVTRRPPTDHVKASVSYEDNHVSIWRYYPSLDTIIGPSPRFSLLLSSHNTSHNPFFDGSSCAYSSRRDELIVTTNLLKPRDPAQMPVILICRIKLQRDGEGSIQKVDWSKLRPPSMMAMPAGAVVHGDDESILYCSQGNFEQGAWPPDKFVEGSGGLFRMGQGGRQPPEPIVTSFFGTEFGCVSSVAIERSGEREALWFVDAGRRGFESGFRHRPRLPAAVWRYVPSTGDLRAMTDDLKRPWSIALAPNGETVYVTNCDPGDDESALEDNMTAGIYAFDIAYRFGSPSLTAKRLFARAMRGIPRGIICDSTGNVFAGCGDGVEIWNPGGSLLGVIRVPAPVKCMGWGLDGEMFICAEETLWAVYLAPHKELSDQELHSSLSF